MTEQQIQDLLKEEKWINLVKKLKQIYPNGFDINKIDKRIKNKLEDRTKAIDIQMPDKGISTKLRRELMKYKD